MTSKSELKRQNIMRGRPMIEGMEKLERLQTLKSLQSRIREATGADRELDLEIAQLFRPNGEWSLTYQPRLPSLYTTDPDGIGACVGLFDTVLTTSHWSRDEDGFFWVHVFVGTPQEHRVGGKCLSSRCLMLLDAICAALIAEEEAKECVK